MLLFIISNVITMTHPQKCYFQKHELNFLGLLESQRTSCDRHTDYYQVSDAIKEKKILVKW